MESTHLLLIEHCPEAAEHTKSVLRNSGISIRISRAESPSELDSSLRDINPFLILLSDQALAADEVGPALELARQSKVPVVLRAQKGHASLLPALLAEGPCLVIDAGSEEQLCRVVGEHLTINRLDAREQTTKSHAADLQNLYQLLLDTTRDPIAYLHEGLHIDANQAYLNSLQLTCADQLAGLSILELMKGVDQDLKEVLRDLGHGQFPEDAVAVRVKTPEGHEFLGDLTFSSTRYNDEDCVQVLLREADQTAKLRAEIEQLRTTDPLTHMLNRESFMPRLNAHLLDSDRRSATSALLYLQPNGFEEYQSTLGHTGADCFLSGFAERVRSCLGSEDLACRFSDHALAVLLCRDEGTHFEHVAQAILDACADHVVGVENLELTTSCSIGMLLLGPSTENADEAITQAQVACIKASEQGHAFVRYMPKLAMVALDASSEQGWRERLRFGLDHGSFYSLQQSIVDLEGNSEGLSESHSYLREDQGDIAQEEFLPAAEICQLGAEIDRALIPGLLSAISGGDRGVRHVLNITIDSMLDEGFPAWLEQELDKQGIAGASVVLQVPVQAALSHQSGAARLVEALRPLGCGLSLSDFDGDARNLRLLGKLGVALIKLNRELADGLQNDQGQRETVLNLVKTTTGSGIEIFADGIHEATHLATLWQVGIKLVAGDFLQEAPQVVGQ